MAQHSTQMEALIADLLGDVGKLNDQVKSLSESLPSQAERFEARLKYATNTLLNATEKFLVPRVYGSKRADEEVFRVVERLDSVASRMQSISLMLKEFESSMHGTAKYVAREVSASMLQNLIKDIAREFALFDDKNIKALAVVEESNDQLKQCAKAFHRVVGWGERWAFAFAISIAITLLIGVALGSKINANSVVDLEQACTSAAIAVQKSPPAKLEVGMGTKKERKD
jgi:uncharacterized protein YoxC